MITLAIDPGFDRIGVALIEKEKGQKEILLFSDCITTDKKDDIYSRILYMGSEIEKLIQKYNPSQLAIENLFFKTNQKTAMNVAEARGVIIYTAKKHGLSIFEYTPLQVKTALTGYGKSDKVQVAFMTEKLIQMEVKKRLDDELDAIAIGLTHTAHQKL